MSLFKIFIKVFDILALYTIVTDQSFFRFKLKAHGPMGSKLWKVSKFALFVFNSFSFFVFFRANKIFYKHLQHHDHLISLEGHLQSKYRELDCVSLRKLPSQGFIDVGAGTPRTFDLVHSGNAKLQVATYRKNSPWLKFFHKKILSIFELLNKT